MKLILTCLVLSTFAFGAEHTQELQSETDTFNEYISKNETLQKDVSLELVRVRTVLEAGVEVPGVTNASINPEIELYFSK